MEKEGSSRSPENNKQKNIINAGKVRLIGSAKSLSDFGPTIVNSLLAEEIYGPREAGVELFDQDKADATLSEEIHPLEAVAQTAIRVMVENMERSIGERHKKLSAMILGQEMNQAGPE